MARRNRGSPLVSVNQHTLATIIQLIQFRLGCYREQILGKEARARVPAEFMIQHPSHANPPSLYLPLLAHATSAARASADSGELAATKAFLKRAWPRLEAWYTWFNTTQAGKMPGTYM